MGAAQQRRRGHPAGGRHRGAFWGRGVCVWGRQLQSCACREWAVAGWWSSRWRPPSWCVVHASMRVYPADGWGGAGRGREREKESVRCPPRTTPPHLRSCTPNLPQEGAFQSWAEFALVLAVIILNCAIGLVRGRKQLERVSFEAAAHAPRRGASQQRAVRCPLALVQPDPTTPVPYSNSNRRSRRARRRRRRTPSKPCCRPPPRHARARAHKRAHGLGRVCDRGACQRAPGRPCVGRCGGFCPFLCPSARPALSPLQSAVSCYPHPNIHPSIHPPTRVLSATPGPAQRRGAGDRRRHPGAG